MNRVSGKVAVITGAARGMGAAHAKLLIEEGAKVVLTDILEKEVIETARNLGKNAHPMHHDVTSEAQWKQVIEETESLYGPVSVLVNNAGIVTAGNIESLAESDYRRTIDVNQVSVFLGMKAVIPSMKRAGGGSIINISSVAGLKGVAHCLSYVASKFAVRGMTKTAAIELAPFNICANSIHPGLIATPMNADSPEEALKEALSVTPAGRHGDSEEVANVVLMLASDEVRYATGVEFVIDGGLTCG